MRHCQATGVQRKAIRLEDEYANKTPLQRAALGQIMKIEVAKIEQDSQHACHQICQSRAEYNR